MEACVYSLHHPCILFFERQMNFCININRDSATYSCKRYTIYYLHQNPLKKSLSPILLAHIQKENVYLYQAYRHWQVHTPVREKKKTRFRTPLIQTTAMRYRLNSLYIAPMSTAPSSNTIRFPILQIVQQVACHTTIRHFLNLPAMKYFRLLTASPIS